MILRNGTKYVDIDLRRIVALGFDKAGVSHTDVVVTVNYRGSMIEDGCAEAGHEERPGKRMGLFVDREPTRETVRKLAALVYHEALHLRGVPHEAMNRATRHASPRTIVADAAVLPLGIRPGREPRAVRSVCGSSYGLEHEGGEHLVVRRDADGNRVVLGGSKDATAAKRLLRATRGY